MTMPKRNRFLGMVQMNLTVFKPGNQSQRWLRIGIGLKRKGCSLREIAQSHQPIVVLLRHAATHKGTLPSMEATLGDAVIVPDGQHRQHADRKGAMDRQVRAQHTMPILDGTTGTHS